MLGLVVSFKLPGSASPADRVRFSQRVWGRAGRRGFMDGVPHVKLVRAAFLVRLRDGDRVSRFLGENGAVVVARRVHLEPDDLERLGLA